MKIMTLNVNGIRAACRKGFLEWMLERAPDVVCLQEMRIEQGLLPAELVAPPGYAAFFNPAVKKGYSGVAVYSRRAPKKVTTTLGWPGADTEGRYLLLDFEKVSIGSIYLPSGSAGPHRQALKYEFMQEFEPLLRKIRRRRLPTILCGDWNIAHRQIDLKNWRGNQKNSGFLPEERAWMDLIFDNIGLVDAFRVVNPEPDQYTFWSSRGRAWEKNVGWRIDYQVVSPALRDRIRGAEIYKERRFSDHAPLIIEYDLDL